MGWRQSGPESVVVSYDKQVRTTFDGDFMASGVSVGYYWDDPTAEELAQDPHLHRVMRIVERPYNKTIHVTAVTVVETTVEELRGCDSAQVGSDACRAGGYEVSWSSSLNQSGYGIQASGKLRLLECRGTQITYSGRRANEAGGWVTIKTTVVMTTTVNHPSDCTLTEI